MAGWKEGAFSARSNWANEGLLSRHASPEGITAWADDDTSRKTLDFEYHRWGMKARLIAKSLVHCAQKWKRSPFSGGKHSGWVGNVVGESSS